MNEILQQIRQELRQRADAKIRESGKTFFKEEVKFYGIKTAVVEKIAKQSFKGIQDRTKAKIFDLCEELWRSGLMEEALIACRWSYALREGFTAADFKIFEHWVNQYVTNWASCDTLCNHTVGTFLEMYPGHAAHLKKWARSKNRWMRRAAAVSLIIPARQGQFLNDIFEIADQLLLDEDDLVQKGYGWMLKAASQAHQKKVFDYVMSHKKVMPRTALRYAIEKMPKELKAKAMVKKSNR